jgi:hypothetical protein
MGARLYTMQTEPKPRDEEPADVGEIIRLSREQYGVPGAKAGEGPPRRPTPGEHDSPPIEELDPGQVF